MKNRHLIRKFIGLLFFAVFLAVLYVATVLNAPADRDTAAPATAAGTPLPAIEPFSSADASALTAVFGRLPIIPDAPFAGTVSSGIYEGQNVWIAVMDYGSCVLSAVKPSEAAPLLLRPGLSVDMAKDSLLCQGLNVLWAQKGDAMCLYFSDAEAAYSLYAPHVSQEEMESLS